MKVTLLGTGTSQGVPIIGSDHPVCKSSDPKDKRLRVSALLEWGDKTYVIDSGPDFRQQMLANDVSKIDGILYTHEHNDHVIGLDDVRPFYFRQGNIAVYAHKRVMNELKKRFEYIFAIEDKYPGAPTLDENIITNEAFTLGQKKVIPINVYHGQLQVFGFRIDDFAYVTDAKYIADEEIDKLKGVKVLVLNALRKDEHRTHLNLEQAIEVAQKIGAGQTYFTHISHHMGFHKDVEKKLPENIHLGYDNLQIEL
jgi:phosphoribosyl 1,2-cyclic phosphate phosphodiesterase